MNNNDCLQHHGIYGMKWGVRRYQNEDGSLTPAGKARMLKVKSSGLQSKLETDQARFLLKKELQSNIAYASQNQHIANKALKKAEKNSLDPVKKRKYMEQHDKAKKLGKEYMKAVDLLDKKLTDINEGKLKAGRDFIVQKDINLYPILPFGIVYGVDYTLIEERKKSK